LQRRWLPKTARQATRHIPRDLSRLLTCGAVDTLIVWTEPSNGVDMALSFQEAEGCAMIWSVPSYLSSDDENRSLTDVVCTGSLSIMSSNR
jgi:hypothetical protein